MAFDPSVISAIPEMAGNPVDSIGKALGIRDMVDRDQMERLQLGAAKREAKETAQVQDILKTSDYTTPQGLAETVAKVNKVSPQQGMNLLKWGQSYQSGQIAAQEQELSLANQRQGLIVQALDPIVAQARQMKNNGASDLDIRAFITKEMPGAISQLRSLQLPDGKPALPDDQLKMVTQIPGGFTLSTLESWESRSKQGQAALQQRLKQFQADTQSKREAESERHDRAMEALTGSKASAAQFTDPERNLIAAFADANVKLPAGLRSQSDIKAELDGLLERHKDMTADQIAAGLNSGALKFTAETRAAQTAGTQIGKVALAANELDTFGDQVLAASKNVSRLPAGLTIRGLLQMAQKQASNTGLLTLKLKLQALNNAYDQLASRGGTDADKREHIASLFDARLTDEGIQALVTGVKQEAAGARQAADRTIAETSSSSIPGAGAPAGSPGAQPGIAPNAPPAVAPSGGQTPRPAAAAPPPAGGSGAGNVVNWSDLQ